VFWGLLHGIFQVVERGIGELHAKLSEGRTADGVTGENTAGKANVPQKAGRGVQIVRVCVTFALVCFAWLFFRANTLADAFLITRKFASLPSEWTGYFAGLSERGIVNTVRVAFQIGSISQGVTHSIAGFGMMAAALSVMSLIILVAGDVWSRTVAGTKRIMHLPLAIRWAGYYALVLVIVLSWSVDSSQFIYFTF
jgi:hypothetical protein